MLLQPGRLNDEQQSAMVKLCQLFPQIEKAKELAQEFTRKVRERSADNFNDWLRSAMQTGKSSIRRDAGIICGCRLLP